MRRARGWHLCPALLHWQHVRPLQKQGGNYLPASPSSLGLRPAPVPDVQRTQRWRTARSGSRLALLALAMLISSRAAFHEKREKDDARCRRPARRRSPPVTLQRDPRSTLAIQRARTVAPISPAQCWRLPGASRAVFRGQIY